MNNLKNSTSATRFTITTIFRIPIALLLAAVLATGCSDSPSRMSEKENPSPSSESLGLVEVTVSGIGTNKMKATATSPLSLGLWGVRRSRREVPAAPGWGGLGTHPPSTQNADDTFASVIPNRTL